MKTLEYPYRHHPIHPLTKMSFNSAGSPTSPHLETTHHSNPPPRTTPPPFSPAQHLSTSSLLPSITQPIPHLHQTHPTSPHPYLLLLPAPPLQVPISPGTKPSTSQASLPPFQTTPPQFPLDPQNPQSVLPNLPPSQYPRRRNVFPTNPILPHNTAAEHYYRPYPNSVWSSIYNNTNKEFQRSPAGEVLGNGQRRFSLKRVLRTANIYGFPWINDRKSPKK